MINEVLVMYRGIRFVPFCRRYFSIFFSYCDFFLRIFCVATCRFVNQEKELVAVHQKQRSLSPRDMKFFLPLCPTYQFFFGVFRGQGFRICKNNCKKISKKCISGRLKINYPKLLKNNFKLIISPPNGGAEFI